MSLERIQQLFRLWSDHCPHLTHPLPTPTPSPSPIPIIRQPATSVHPSPTSTLSTSPLPWPQTGHCPPLYHLHPINISIPPPFRLHVTPSTSPIPITVKRPSSTRLPPPPHRHLLYPWPPTAHGQLLSYFSRINISLTFDGPPSIPKSWLSHISRINIPRNMWPNCQPAPIVGSINLLAKQWTLPGSWNTASIERRSTLSERVCRLGTLSQP